MPEGWQATKKPEILPDECAGGLADNEKSNRKKGALNCGEAVSLFKLLRRTVWINGKR